MHLRRKERGFSLLEALVVISIIAIMGGMAFISTRDALKNQRAESALQDVLNMTRTARQLAIDKRRVFMVSYSAGPGMMTMTVTAPNNSAAGCAAATAPWPDPPGSASPPTPVIANFDFAWITGAPVALTGSSAAPDGFGTGAAPSGPINFVSTKNPTSVCFYPDGSARDANNAFNGGVLYLAPAATSEASTSIRLNNMRAVTIFGPTGRISGWRISQTSSGLQWKQW